MGVMTSAAIRPLYRAGEASLLLRGTRARRPVMRALEWLSRSNADAARRAFEAAIPDRVFLDAGYIDDLVAKYSYGATRADQRLPQEKARGRAMEVLRSTRKFVPADAKFLEIACGDGRVAAAMSRAGRNTTAIDISPERLSDDARQAGVKFVAMDAERLHLPPGSFDVVYSFDAFEHFREPEQVLSQIARVLKPGGVMYGSFGPLYFSAHGGHQWHSVDVPYCHLLFAEEDLNRAATVRGKIPLVRNLNRWRLRDYRAMFYRSLDAFEKVHYFEKFNVTHVDLVLAFPSIFRSRTDAFDDLIVRSIEFLLRKRG